MTPEFYEQVCRICYGALQLEADQRSSYLDQACASNPSLRMEVEAMLAHEGRVESFLATPALIVAADQVAEADPKATIPLPGDNRTNGTHLPSSEIAVESFEPGTTLGGRYLIDKELGQGGICAVFLARDQKLHDTPVVIKVLMKIWQQTRLKAWLEKKFKGEIAALARIDHPGVVRALDVGELPDGRSYLVMQYVPGESLRSVMTPEGMEFEHVAKLIRQMGQALAAAHRQGVIHRDLKPENIMLQTVGDEEYVKLIDFGIATVHEIEESADNQTTEVVGTRSYVAPEQLRGKPVAASDIYALGVIAYEMLTGQRPFNSESIFHLYELQRAGVKTKPCHLRPGLPEAAQSMILKGLSFAPQDRFTNAKEFADALANALIGEKTQPSLLPPTFAIQRRSLLIVAIVLVAVIGTLALPSFYFRGGTETKPPLTYPLVPAARHLSYSMEVQRAPRPRLHTKPFATFDNVIFGAGDQVRFYISSPQSGFLYVINEGPTKDSKLPNFNVLFPDTETGGSPEIKAGQKVPIPQPGRNQKPGWFYFDQEEGTEKIWLVWSEHLVPKLEAVKGWANPKDEGAIRDPIQRASVADYLAEISGFKPEVERDLLSKQTRLKAKGEMLVWLMQLEHH